MRSLIAYDVVVKWFPRRSLITDELWNISLDRHPILRGHVAESRLESHQTEPRQADLRSLAEKFLRSMQVRWAPGVEPQDDLQVSLAALACLPVMNLDLRWYRRWRTVLLVPHDYETESVEIDEAGVVHEAISDAAGEYSEMGTVVLSLEDLRKSGTGTGFNVVVHECAHVLDGSNGVIDGTPPLHAGMDESVWRSVFQSAHMDLQHRITQGIRRRHSKTRNFRRERPHRRSPEDRYKSRRNSRHWDTKTRDRCQDHRQDYRKDHCRDHRREQSLFDRYAAESREEFFATASELFFERPRDLADEYPRVHEQLVLFYGQNGA